MSSLTKGTQHRRQLLKIFLTCAKIVHEWDLKDVTIAHVVDGVLTGLLLISAHPPSPSDSIRGRVGLNGQLFIYLLSYITDTWGKLDSHVPILSKMT